MSTLLPDSRPRLPSGVRTRFDEARGTWLLLAPERTLKLDEIGAAILGELDGERTLAEIVDALAARYEAPRDEIAADVEAFLGALMERRMVEVEGE